MRARTQADVVKPRDGLVIPDWPAPPNIRAVVTTRNLPGASKPPFDRFNLGVRCGDDAAAVVANRAALGEMLELAETPRWLRQVHGSDVHDADALLADVDPEADASVTHRPGRVLAILTADCMPVFLCAEDGTAVGIAHAGWRGLSAGVIEATIAQLGVAPASLIAWLGPAIGARSYEVGDEVRAAFVDADANDADAFAPTRPGHWTCDLYALACARLARAGVTRVAGGGFDTFADARFYSYRRDRETGRFASLIWIEPAKVRAGEEKEAAAIDGADALQPVFARLLGDAFETLMPRVRELHRRAGTHRWRGAATVRRGRGWLARLCGWLADMPGATPNTPEEVEIDAGAAHEMWTRRFGTGVLSTNLWSERGLLRERFGPMTFGFALSAEAGALCWRVREAQLLGLRLPPAWFTGVFARESEADGRYRFEARAQFPLAGDVVHYKGWLAAADG
jgi:YfiH family protein